MAPSAAPPDWVRRGSAQTMENGVQVAYGVGAASSRDVAEIRAKAEVGRFVSRELADQAPTSDVFYDAEKNTHYARVRVEARPVAPPPEPPKPAPPRASATVVAVFDVEDASHRTKAETLDQLTEYLTVQITRLAGLKVVPRNQLHAQMQAAKNETFKVCYDEACQIELGKAVAAQKSIATKLLNIEDRCAITSTLYDLKTETTERAASVDTDCSTKALLDAMKQVAQQLNGR
jgi:TolB-like protein